MAQLILSGPGTGDFSEFAAVTATNGGVVAVNSAVQLHGHPVISCAKTGSASAYVRLFPGTAPLGHLWYRFAFRVNVLPESNAEALMLWRISADECGLVILPDGQIGLQGWTLVGSRGQIEVGKWHVAEVLVGGGGSHRTVFRLDGVTLCDEDHQFAPSDITSVHLGACNRFLKSLSVDVADIIVDDTRSWGPEYAVYELKPNGPGSIDGWDGAYLFDPKWTGVVERPHDGDATALIGSTPFDQITFACEDLPAGAVPELVKVWSLFRGDAMQLVLLLGTEGEPGGMTGYAATYALVSSTYAGTPNLREPWTEAAVNAIEIGAVQYGQVPGDESRFTAIGATVVALAAPEIGPADHLEIEGPAGPIQAGAPITLSITIKDAAGRTVSTDPRTITLDLVDGDGVVLHGTTSLPTAAGVATWTAAQGLNITTSGQYRLRATHSGAALPGGDTAVTDSFAVTHAAAHHMVFVVQPVDSAAGQVLELMLVLRDQYENQATSGTRTISLELLSAHGATLLGQTSVAVFGGVASWGEPQALRITKTGSGYQLRASHNGAPLAGGDTLDSQNFAISPAAADHLVVTAPSLVVAGETMTITAAVQDVYGNLTADAGRLISLSLAGGVPLAGFARATTVAGVATWSAAEGVHATLAGVHQLVATNEGTAGDPLTLPGGDTVTSDDITVTAGALHHLAFGTVPTEVVAGEAMTATVTARDRWDNLVTDAVRTVTLAVVGAPGRLLGQVEASFAAGVATWANVRIEDAGTWRLQAAAEGVTTIQAATATVIRAAAAHHLTFLTQPAGGRAGQLLTPAVAIHDAFGNVVPDDPREIRLAVVDDAATLAGDEDVITVAGVATWGRQQSLRIDPPGTYRLRATHSGAAFAGTDAVDLVESDPFDVVAAQSVIVLVADAVVSALNSRSFSQAFTAVRGYRPTYDLKEMRDLRVTVVPRSVEVSQATRTLTQRDVQIDVGVQKKLTNTDNADIDPLMVLVQEISDFIIETKRFGPALLVGSDNRIVFSPEHLVEARQFTSVLTFTLRVMS